MGKALPFIEFGKIAEFRNGINFNKDSHGKGCWLIGVADFQNNFTPNYDSLEEVNPEGITKEDDYLKRGDIIFVRSNGNKALVGRSLYIDRDVKALFSGFCIRARLTTDIVDPLFLAYYTRTKQFRSLISSIAGTSINNLNQDILGNVKLPLYPRDVQSSITDVLSSIDKKIELNRRINAELDAMAKTLYDYWFVQFDFPNEKGKPYKSAGGKMVWNEDLKREIPLGWEAKSLSEITEVSTESVNPMNSPQKEYRHYSIPAFDEIGTYKVELGEEIMSNKFVVKGSDLLVSKLNPWFNRVVYATNDPDLICSSEFVVWRTENVSIKNYLYMGAKDAPFIDYCTRSASGTSHSHRRVNPQVMMRYQIPYKKEIATQFGSILGASIEMLAKNRVESQTLTELRDWLLPMLMNGQVKVG